MHIYAKVSPGHLSSFRSAGIQQMLKQNLSLDMSCLLSISSVWFLKSKIFGQESTYSQFQKHSLLANSEFDPNGTEKKPSLHFVELTLVHFDKKDNIEGVSQPLNFSEKNPKEEETTMYLISLVKFFWLKKPWKWTTRALRQIVQVFLSLFFSWSNKRYSRYGLRRCVRCAVERVRAKWTLKHVCEVRACGPFFHWSHPHTCDHTFSPFFGTKRPDNNIFGLKIFYFKTSFHVLEHLFMF